MQDASPPCFVLDLSKAKDGPPDCFLMGYRQEGGSLEDLALVSGGAVYSTSGILRGDDVGHGEGLKQHVHKPASKKMLTPEIHLGKVIAALDAVAAASAATASAPTPAATNGAGAGSGGSGGAVATLEVEMNDTMAVLTVKEALRVGSVVLATVKLPVVEEAGREGEGSGVLVLLRKLLLGSVREAHKRAREAEEMRRDRARAREEHVKVQGLLDSAIRDKRKTVTKILEGAALVINAKKVRIEHLEDKIQRLEEKAGDSGGSGGSEDEAIDGDAASSAPDGAYDDNDGGDGGGSTDDEDGIPPSRTGGKTAKAKGKGRAALGVRPAADGAAAADAVASASGADPSKPAGKGKGDSPRKGAGAEGARGSSTRGGVGGVSGVPGEGKVKVKVERNRLMGAGGGALATPLGTQEVSGEDLLQIVDSKVKSEAREASQKDKSGGGGTTTRKRPRQHSSSPPKRASVFDESDDDRDDNGDGSDSDNDGGGGAKKYPADNTDSSESDTASAPRKPRRRRRLKKVAVPSAAGGAQGSGGGGAAAPKSAGTASADAGGDANGGDAPPKTGFSWMSLEAAADSSEDDLSGMN